MFEEAQSAAIAHSRASCHIARSEMRTLAHIADLVLYVALLPPGGGCAGGRIEEVMIAHQRDAPDPAQSR